MKVFSFFKNCKNMFGRCRSQFFSKFSHFQSRNIIEPCKFYKKPNSKLNFHTQSQLSAKVFNETENKYAHEVLKKYNYNIFQESQLPSIPTEDIPIIDEILNRKEATENIDELFQNFKTLVKFCNLTQTSISDGRFDNLIDTFTDNCNKLTDDQLIESIKLLKLLPENPGVNTRNYVELWSTLDYACIDRIDTWSIDKLLLVCDCWYVLNLGKCSEFVWESLRKIGRRIIKLSPNDLVQTMFYCNLVRKPLIEMFDFEIRFSSIIDSLTIEEISVMCMGFFKTQTPIRNQVLIDKIYKRLFAEINTIQDLTLVNIIKLLRYSTKLAQSSSLMEMMDRLGSQVNRLSLLSCLHIALSGCDLQMCNDKTIHLIIERFNRDIDSARLKDMERICHVMGLFNIQTTSGVERELCTKILSKVRDRVEEIVKYPRCFPACLHYLTLCCFHDEELISVALDEKFIKHAYGGNLALGREIFCLDSYTKINLKNSYTGNHLTDKQRSTMGRILTHYIPDRNSGYKLSVTDRILLEVKENCENLHKFSSIRHILPHYERPDVIIAYDKAKKETICIEENLPTQSEGKVLTREDLLYGISNTENIEIIIMIVGGWNNFLRNNNRITGLLKLKVEQMEILGYKAILIPWHEWREQDTSIDKHNYLRSKFLRIL